MAEARSAVAEMFLELCALFHACGYPPDQEPPEIDADLAVVAVAAMLGHSAGQPMNVSEIAARVRMPRTSVLRRLELLEQNGLLAREDGRFYLDPYRAEHMPHGERAFLILVKCFTVVGPLLSEMDR
jgi:DNA-binding transcriptional ArsR family regulator